MPAIVHRMSPKRRPFASWLTVMTLAVTLTACRASTHPVVAAELGTPTTQQQVLENLAVPGPVVVETLTLATWAVERAGMINLDHPRARAAGLEAGDEPIEVYAHALVHPKHGLFLIDAGLDPRLSTAPDEAVLPGVLSRFLNVDKLRVHQSLGQWVAAQSQPVRGVLLSHLHLDHSSGLPLLPDDVAVYAGPGETHAKTMLNGLVQAATDRALAGKGPVREFTIAPQESDIAAGMIDVFGDQSVVGLWEPGHTAGSMAYLIRSTRGPVLLTGDVCHTRWGWDHQVEPGTFSVDRDDAAVALARLQWLSQRVPNLDVRLGHQH